MKPYLGIAAMVIVVGCTSTEQRQHARVMDFIERDIQMPSGAGTLNQFARAYKRTSPTRVVAFYFIPDDKPDGSFCKSAKEYGPTNGQILLGCPPPNGMRAGERRWLADDMSLPNVDDGGCSYIDVEYDLESKTVTHARCHGTA